MDKKQIKAIMEMPAFPIEGVKGLSMIAYFAARAPAEPQPWFKPILPTKPRGFWKGDNGMTYDSEHAARRDNGEDGYTSTVANEIRQWADECVKQRYIQWPAAWAEAVLTSAIKLDEKSREDADVEG